MEASDSEGSVAVHAIGAAVRDVEAAELELEKVLSTVAIAPRAEKVAISEPVERALDRLREVRSQLSEVEAAIGKALRACITHHDTGPEDVRALVDEVGYVISTSASISTGTP